METRDVKVLRTVDVADDDIGVRARTIVAGTIDKVPASTFEDLRKAGYVEPTQPGAHEHFIAGTAPSPHQHIIAGEPLPGGDGTAPGAPGTPAANPPVSDTAIPDDWETLAWDAKKKFVLELTGETPSSKAHATELVEAEKARRAAATPAP